MDPIIQPYFDGQLGLTFNQGESRTIAINLLNKTTQLPINLTGAVIGVNFPLSGGGSIKRTTLGPTVSASQVVVFSSSVPYGYINSPDHGLVTGDPVQVSLISGGLPAPLSGSTNYLIQTIDVNNFYITNTSGAIISLTTQGSGSFNLINSNDLVLVSGDLGQITLNLRALVSAQVNAALAQNFQVEYVLSGGTRIAIIQNLLDIYPQPVP